MKQNDIVKVMAESLGAADVAEINKILKSKEAPQVKFRITTTKSTHFGFTGLIKMLTEDGLKVFDVNKVTLIRFADIETFEKAGPRVERPVRPKTPVVAKKVQASKHEALDDDTEDFDDEDELPLERNKKKPAGKAGSAFIPKK